MSQKAQSLLIEPLSLDSNFWLELRGMAQALLSEKNSGSQLAALVLGRFPAVEINSPFYLRRPLIPSPHGAIRRQDFIFAWKASKFITHWKRLTEKCRKSLKLIETRLRVLGHKLGPVLSQFPPVER
jgi:uncharacterized protein YecE (DUF72 family)